ncbi:release factor glutamine methyltransferase [Cohnella xylanilytica]|nr:release factor glutamine methyltransferase [Cohnella xylanilytica]
MDERAKREEREIGKKGGEARVSSAEAEGRPRAAKELAGAAGDDSGEGGFDSGKAAAHSTGEKARTIGETWRAAAACLRAAGVGEEDANAELLLLHLLGVGKAELLRDWREPFPEGRRAEWDALLARKAAGEPAQYIVGGQSFYGRWFRVRPGVLIPRPETELLAEAVLAAAGELGGEGAALTALDIGTGSGALAVTLAAERPAWRVFASDLSPDALEVARGNAAANGVGERIAFAQGDLLEPFIAAERGGAGTAAEGGLAADILVSNPPYIPSADLSGLQREVRDYEPRLALDGGPDGLAPYRRMAERLRLLPRLPRLVAWEVGAGQADDAAALLRAAAEWERIWFVKDYAGIDRHVMAIRR